MKKIVLMLLLCPMALFAQDGIKFDHAQTWNEILSKAKAENKYIFVDAFTTWCGPCKYMSKNIFPKKDVGEYFNKNFVNLKVQLDTTGNDNAEVKQWYADAHHLMTTYSVNVFPTYLFFSPDGKLVHRAVGSSEAVEFMAKAAIALDPESQYYTLLDQYNAGKKEAGFLKKMAYASLDVYDKENMAKISEAYLNTQTDYYTTENISFIDKFTEASTDKGFQIIMANPEKYDKVNGQGSANQKLVGIILNEEVYPKILSRKATASPDWKLLNENVSKKFPAQSAEVIATAKATYYQAKKDWANFQVAVLDYMQKYGANVSPEKLNNFAWTVFENCNDMNCVKEALSWSKRSFADNNSPMFMDTYANILYKMGKKKEAITWEEKAMALADESEKGDYKETLEKMKKGEKTWKD